jgi:hypothetical protein
MQEVRSYNVRSEKYEIGSQKMKIRCGLVNFVSLCEKVEDLIIKN